MNWIITLTLLWSLTLTRGDDTVTCLFSQVCVLPCQSSYLEVIHWQKINGQSSTNVHSFYEGANKLEHQDAAYTGRTSLPTDQFPKGNISLILSGVKIEDEGRYKCYTADRVFNKETYVNVKVKDPVKSVEMTRTDHGITCKTSHVYPKPKITWTVDGISRTVDGPSSEPQKDSQGFFSLASTVRPDKDQDNFTYNCYISFEDGAQTYTASIVHKKVEIDLEQNLIVECPKSLGDTGNFTLTLEGSSDVLSYNSQTTQSVFPKQWNGMNVNLAHDKNIELQTLEREKYAGTYTCERTTTDSRQIMQTSVQIKSESITTIVIGVIVGVVAVVAIAFLIILILKRCKKSQNIEKKPDGSTEEDKESTEDIPLNAEHNGPNSN